MLIGYARISTHEQHLDLHKDALEKAGYKKKFPRPLTKAYNQVVATIMEA